MRAHLPPQQVAALVPGTVPGPARPSAWTGRVPVGTDRGPSRGWAEPRTCCPTCADISGTEPKRNLHVASRTWCTIFTRSQNCQTHIMVHPVRPTKCQLPQWYILFMRSTRSYNQWFLEWCSISPGLKSEDDKSSCHVIIVALVLEVSCAVCTGDNK